MRAEQVKLLDKEAKARGLTRSEMFLVLMTQGLVQARSERLLGQSEPKASTSPAKSEAPAPVAKVTSKTPAARRPAKPAEVPTPVAEAVDEGPPKRLMKTKREIKAEQEALAAKPDGLEDVPDMLKASIVEEAPKTAPQSQPAASTDEALKGLGITETTIGENPFDYLNDAPRSA